MKVSETTGNYNIFMLIGLEQQKLQRTRTGSETCALLGSPCEGVSQGVPQGRRLC